MNDIERLTEIIATSGSVRTRWAAELALKLLRECGPTKPPAPVPDGEFWQCPRCMSMCGHGIKEHPISECLYLLRLDHDVCHAELVEAEKLSELLKVENQKLTARLRGGFSVVGDQGNQRQDGDHA